MDGFLRQSTSVDVGIGPFVDATDGVTAETALTITQPDVRLKKISGAWAQKAAAQTLTHEENGYYEVTLDATDTDTIGILKLAVHESGALPVFHNFSVLSAEVYDAMFGTSGLATRNDASVIAAGTAQAGASGSIQLAAATSFSDDLINGAEVHILSGTGVGQSRRIIDWVSATDTATVSPNWGTAPDTTSVYRVFASAPAVGDVAALPTVLISQGTGTGQLDLTAGIVKAHSHTGENLALASVLGIPTTDIAGDIADIQTRLPDELTAAGLIKADGLRLNGTVVLGAGTSGNKWRA